MSSFQGMPRPDPIFFVRGDQTKAPEIIWSTGHYQSSPNAKPIKMDPRDKCYAFGLVAQFQSFAVPTPKAPKFGCCDYYQNFLEYGEVRMPAHYVPELVKLFDYYHGK